MPRTLFSFRRAAVAVAIGLSLLAGGLVAPAAAHAEGQLRIAEQFGVVYLLLNVVRDQQLIEKHGKAAETFSPNTEAPT